MCNRNLRKDGFFYLRNITEDTGWPLKLFQISGCSRTTPLRWTEECGFRKEKSNLDNVYTPFGWTERISLTVEQYVESLLSIEVRRGYDNWNTKFIGPCPKESLFLLPIYMWAHSRLSLHPFPPCKYDCSRVERHCGERAQA